MTNNLKNSDVSVAAFISALTEESKSKTKVEVQGSKRRALALQVAMSYPDTRATWERLIDHYYSGNDALRDEAREAIVTLSKADGMEGSEKTNHVNRALQSVTFAIDMIRNGLADCIRFNNKGGAVVVGGSRLALEIWRQYKWNDLKTMNDRSTDEEIKIVPKQSDKKPGTVSWPMLENVSREKAGRKVSGTKKAANGTVITPDKPMEALKVLSSIAADADPQHFNTDGGKISAINTAEDVLALAIEEERFSDLRKEADALFQKIRDRLSNTHPQALVA